MILDKKLSIFFFFWSFVKKTALLIRSRDIPWQASELRTLRMDTGSKQVPTLPFSEYSAMISLNRVMDNLR